MAREPYNREKEHEIIGTYPPIKGMEIGMNPGSGIAYVPETPRFYRPIPRYQNFHMLFEGKTPYWIPNNGWMFCDINEFRPRQVPDCPAHHQCLDGGGVVDYEAQGKTAIGWFNIPLEWEPLSMGATTRPGHPALTDMSNWEDVISIPDLDEIDFVEMKAMNTNYLGTDKANQLGIQLGLWERMMQLMDVSNAAMALLDEDQEDGIHRFLDKLSDFYIDYIRRVSKIGRIDSVMLHEDWGTQKGPFFSLATCRQFFVPPMKKIVDACHELGIVFEHHCCGKAETLVPAMVECGTDFWFPQASINDVDKLIETYKDEHITFSVSSPLLPKGSSEAQIREMGREFVDKYKDKGILFCQDVSISDPNHDPSLYPIFEDAVYEYSRLAYQDADS